MSGDHADRGVSQTSPVSQKKEVTFSLRSIRKPSGMVSIELVNKLLETTVIDACDIENNHTLLEHACRTSEVSLAKFCFRKGAVLTALTSSGESAVNLATANKCYELMEFLFVYGVPVNFSDAKGRTALHVAASNKDVDAICRLLELGADINARDNDGRTPLHLATIQGHRPTVELLLELGGRLNEADRKGFTAVAHAEVNDHFTLMDRLIALGGQGHRLDDHKEAPKKFGLDESTLKTVRGASLGRISAFPVSSRLPGFLDRLGKYKPHK